MKLLFYCSKFPPLAGGAGTIAFELGHQLSKNGYQVFLICEHYPGLETIENVAPGFTVFRAKVPVLKNKSNNWYFLLLCISIALKGICLIFRQKIDILHCHDTATGIAGLITRFFTRIPTVFKFSGSMTYEYLCNTPRNAWDPALGERGAWTRARGMAKIVLKIEKQYFKTFDRIYSNAEYMLRLLEENFYYRKKHFQLIHNGIDVKALQKRNFADMKQSQNISRMIFTGVRLVNCKGVHLLIQACAPLLEKYNAHLVIAGSGPDEQNLKILAGQNPRIIFLGNLAWHDNINYVRSADVFVLPSFVDKTPSCLMEALSLEIPCIASNINGVKELICDGGGFLVPPNLPHKIAEKIEWIFEHPSEAKQMGINGRHFMEKNFSWENTQQQIESLYENLLQEKSCGEKTK